MSTKRIKAESFANRLSFEIAVDRCSFVEAELRRLNAEKDQAVQEAQKTHADEIATLDTELKATAALCEKYGTDHRSEILPDENVKSVVTNHSRYGFRTGNRTVVLLNKKCSWDAAVKLLKRLPLLGCVRTEEAVNKEAVLAQTDAKGVLRMPEGSTEKKGYTVDLEIIGLKIKQVETFFIEPRTDNAETVKAGGAS